MHRTVHPFWSRAALATVALLLASLALAQAAAPSVQVRYDPQLGHHLTGPNGMTLYVFGKDTEGVSNCTGGCADNWPPLMADADTVATAPLAIPGAFSVIDRDGGKQVAYNGRPLYYWAKDAKPGDATGQGVGDVWWVANLEPAVQVLDTKDGKLLVGPTGMALYTFDKDTDGTSACSGGCAANWPPLVGGYDPANGNDVMAADGVSGQLGLIARDDGGMQVTLDGKPLYYWAHDMAAGQTSGDGVGGVWHRVVQ